MEKNQIGLSHLIILCEKKQNQNIGLNFLNFFNAKAKF